MSVIHQGLIYHFMCNYYFVIFFIEKKKRTTKNSIDIYCQNLYYSFPKEPRLRQKWMEALDKQNALIPGDLPNELSYVCSLHFALEDYSHFNNGFGTRLKMGAYPTLFPTSG